MSLIVAGMIIKKKKKRTTQLNLNASAINASLSVHPLSLGAIS